MGPRHVHRADLPQGGLASGRLAERRDAGGVHRGSLWRPGREAGVQRLVMTLGRPRHVWRGKMPSRQPASRRRYTFSLRIGLLEPVAATKYPEVSTSHRTSLLELARLFLKLGAVAFGGPPAHIAMMEEDVVARRGWLTREQFLDFLGAANLIPGPTSTELAIYVGRMQAGWAGLLVAGGCFILPSAIFVTALAWAYVRFGALPQVTGVLYGIKPIVIALIVQAVFKLAKS